MAKSLHVGADARRSSTAINASSSAERRRLSSFSVGLDQLDAGRRLSAEAAAAREERRATGRMVAVIVALVMIFSGFYQAWIKRIPVLAGVMVPMLIMLLYAAWVLFLAKRDKQRRLNQEHTIRSSLTALSDILVMPPATAATAAAAADRRLSHGSIGAGERRPSHSSGTAERRLSHSALQLILLQQQQHHHHAQLQQHHLPKSKRSRRNEHHHHHQHSKRSSSRRGSSAPVAVEHHHTSTTAQRKPSLIVIVEPPTPAPSDDATTAAVLTPAFPTTDRPQRRPSLVRSFSDI